MSELNQALAKADTYVTSAEGFLKLQFDDARSDKRRGEIAALAEIVSDTRIQVTRAIAAAKEQHAQSANHLASMEACACSLNLCLFLFKETRKIVPHDGESDVAIHAFSNIGMRIAEAAEETAWDAASAMEKEVDHE